ncbi:MAG: FkbM family methyltransferase [Oceanicaulis sp.]
MLADAARAPSGAAGAPWGTHAPRGRARLLLWLARHTPLGRGKLRGALLNAFLNAHPGPVDTTLWSAPVRLDPSSNMSEQKPLLRLDRYDRPERAAMLETLDRPGAVLVDIGANMGLYCLDAVLHGPEGVRALAVEPQPAMVERLAFNFAHLKQARVRGADGLELHPVALSSASGVVRLDVGGKEHLAQVVEQGGVEVRALTLLALLDEAGVSAPDVIKIDIEGHEGEVLGPFLEDAPDDRLPRRILIEHLHAEEWTRDVTGLLAKRGYHEARRWRANAAWDRG